MSSILDALNKTQEEKAVADISDPLDYDDTSAVQDLLGHSTQSGGVGLSLNPLVLTVFAIGFVILVGATSVGAALYVTRSRTAPVVVAQPPVASPAATPVPQPAAAAAAPVVSTPAPMPQPVAATAPPVVPAPAPKPAVAAAPPVVAAPAPPKPVVAAAPLVVAAPAPKPPPVVVAAPPVVATPAPTPPPVVAVAQPVVAAPAPTTPQPVAAVALPVIPAPVPTKPPVAEAPVVQAKVSQPVPSPNPPAVKSAPASVSVRPKPVEPEEVDINALPSLTHSDRRRLGLPEFVINMLSRPSKYRPEPSAMINLRRVVLNEEIGESGAVLIGVSTRGIAIEYEGMRFRVIK